MPEAHMEQIEHLLDFADGLLARGRFDAAIKACQQALALDPANVSVYTRLANILEKSNDLENAAKWVGQGLALAPNHHALRMIRAVLLRRGGRTREAVSDLQALLPEASPRLKAKVYFELGHCHDQLGEYELAYSQCEQGNALVAALNPEIEPEPFVNKYVLPTIAWLSQAASPIRPVGEVPVVKDTPVFLVGFPRSGTTLLDQMLDSHPRIRTLSEIHNVWHMRERFPESADAYLARLTSIEQHEVEGLRTVYRAGVRKYLSLEAGDTFVDKHPLNIVHVPLIQTVFPEARYILAIRHPLDACLSCFMNNFQLNSAMANFLSMEGTVRFYAQVMELWRLAQDKLKLNYCMIRYEDLVTDPEGETRRLLTYIGVDWDKQVLRFDRHCLTRSGIATPSYQQVCRPIYQGSKERWRNYEAQLATYAPVLRPYIEYFGY